MERFRQGFGLYISEMESQIIEDKLKEILDSLTFRWSRKPEYLRLVPERLAFDDLKISTKLKVVNKSKQGNFYNTYLESGNSNPDEDFEANQKVPSLMRAQNSALEEQLHNAEAYVQAVMQKSRQMSRLQDQKSYYDGYVDFMRTGHLPEHLESDPVMVFLQ